MADAKTLMVTLKLQAAEFKTGMKEISKDLGKFERQTKGLINPLLAVGAAITAFAVLSVKHFADTAEELGNMAVKTGFSVKSLSELKYAAEQAETSLETIQVAFRKTSVLVTDAAQGNKTANKTLQDLGLSLATLKGKSPEDTFFAVANAVAAEGNAMKRAALAQEAFGRGGLELLPMLADGREGLSKVREEAQRLGIVYDEGLVKKGKQVADQMKSLKAASEGLMISIGSSLMPSVVALARGLVDVVSGFTGWAKENPGIVQAIAAIGVALGSLALALKAVAIAKGIALAMAGPAGWATLAAAGVIAAGTVVGIDELTKRGNATPAATGKPTSTQGGNNITVNVQGNILSPDGLATSIAPAVRREFMKIESRNTAFARP